MITQLVAINIASMQAGTLRHVEGAPGEWRDRLSEHDFRTSLFDALLVESWLWAQIDDEAILDRGDITWGRLLWAVAKPYARFCIADISEKYRRAVLQLSGRKTLCDYDLAAGRSALDVPIPKWNFMAKIVAPSLGGVVDRVARLELDLELTGKVLQLQEARREREGRWPHVMPGIETSFVCPHDSWKYDVEPDGSMSIAFNRDISWPDQLGAILPTCYSAGP